MENASSGQEVDPVHKKYGSEKILPRVVVVGAYPPPVNGMSMVTQHAARILARKGQVLEVNVSPKGRDKNFAYFVRSSIIYLRALSLLLKRPYCDAAVWYLAVNSGLGLIFNISVAVMARLFGIRLVLHHHSFFYLETARRLPALLVGIAGRNSTHICLCNGMASKLRHIYSVPGSVVVVSNAFIVDRQEQQEPRTTTSKHLRIGHLSNLTPEKGADTAIGVYLSLRRLGMCVELHLAGPIASPVIREALASVPAEFRAGIHTLGSINGEAKKAFFREIDVFLFPSRYRVEAQPLVLFEALAAGVPVITTNKGCIAETFAAPGVFIYGEQDIQQEASELIKAWITNPGMLHEERAKASDYFLAPKMAFEAEVQLLSAVFETRGAASR